MSGFLVRLRGRQRVAGLAAVGLVLIVACSPIQAPPQPGVPSGTASPSLRAAPLSTLPCTDPIGKSEDVSAVGQPVLDTIAIPVDQTISIDPSGQDGLYFAKIGLWIRPGHPGTLQLPRSSDAQMGWSNTADQPRGRTFVIPSCPASDGTWTAYPGGFFVRRPACLPLTVTAGTRTATVRVPVGQTCTHR